MTIRRILTYCLGVWNLRYLEMPCLRTSGNTFYHFIHFIGWHHFIYHSSFYQSPHWASSCGHLDSTSISVARTLLVFYLLPFAFLHPHEERFIQVSLKKFRVRISKFQLRTLLLCFGISLQLASQFQKAPNTSSDLNNEWNTKARLANGLGSTCWQFASHCWIFHAQFIHSVALE